MLVLSGKTGNAGFALGPVMIWNSIPTFDKRTITDVNAELERLNQAIDSVAGRLEDLASNSKAEAADILSTQKMMLEDASFLNDIRSIIVNESLNAEYACITAGATKARELELAESPYLRARSDDIQDIAHKLALALTGNAKRTWPSIPSIIYADEITPQDISSMPEGKVLAFVTKTGSSMSHAAILCGTYNIPFLFDVECQNDIAQTNNIDSLMDVDYSDKKDLINKLQGVECAVDTTQAQFIIEPDQTTRASILKKIEEQRLQESEESTTELPIKVYANIGSPDDAKLAIENKADGIGLYRTEFLYMNRSTTPSEEEQFEAYKTVLETMGEREVIVRTMDVGADKQAACLDMPQEPNPALGHRALRICLDDPELFRVQLRALLRAARYGNLAIMLPMVASTQEIDDTIEQLHIAQDELKGRGIECELPSLGIMIETPAAAILSDVMAEKVDFFSIGTNDLAQYALAVDRQGKNLERYFKADHDAVMRLIEITIRNAHLAGIPVGICGEIGGNPDVLPSLIELGVDELSMSPAKIKRAKALIAATLKEPIIEKGAERKKDINSEHAAPSSCANPPLRPPLGAPADGEIIPMEDIPDPTFSQGMMGECIGIFPSNGKIYAPCKGTITMIAETLHAFNIRTDEGTDILVHIGIDTVSLNGKGFSCFIKQGDTVNADDLVMQVDLDFIKSAGLSPIIAVAVMGR